MRQRLLILTAVVFASLGLRVWVEAAPVIPKRQALSGFPRTLGDWQTVAEASVPDRLEGVFGADDYIIRTYRNEAGQYADLLIAYYAVEQAGHGPHSPRNCLPAWGWEPVQSDRIPLAQNAGSSTLWANRYIVENKDQRDVVLYWYRQQGRAVANEYLGKIYFIWDALRTKRRDSALVRITVPLTRGSDGTAETATALNFARASLPDMSRYVPD